MSVMALVLALSALAITGCNTDQTQQQGSSQTTGEVVFTDSRGKKVRVSDPQRVVACMGSFAHIWTLAGGELVGISNDAIDSYGFPEDANTVGDFSALDMESIIALNPDFVLMTSGTGGRAGSSSQTEMAESLEKAGITVACFEVTTFDDYLKMLRTCCDITGRDDLYQQNGQKVADEIKAIKDQVPHDVCPSVFAAITYSGGTRVQDSSSAVGTIVAELGGKNIADSDRSLLSEYSVESVIKANPERILIVPMGNTTDAVKSNLEQNTAANPAWSTISAVQNNHCTALDSSLFLLKPCENWAKAYQAVFDALYE